MIRKCTRQDFETMFAVINDAADAYRGIIPEDRWKEPYMPREELQEEIDSGVVFYGFTARGELVGLMGIQDKGDVTLMRHAYVRTSRRREGIGSQLLVYLQQRTSRPILIGTWADASWAIRFYEKHGYRRVTSAEKDRLLKTYWSIPSRQVETSVVLADRKWFERSDL
ncbi:MAG: GNAT family acetyltransferase [Deltaproteobacteria bacterium SG8_13]|nr:MAG: GNAT family acetyltransferase [Deltaproteobacteria bacterium SG8_13]